MPAEAIPGHFKGCTISTWPLFNNNSITIKFSKKYNAWKSKIGPFLPCRFYTEWCTGKTQRDGMGRWEGALGWGIHVNP